jgi:hypothetical protein
VCNFLGILDTLVGDAMFLGGAGVVAANDGDPRSFTEKGLRRPELFRRPDDGRFGILEAGTDLASVRHWLPSTSDSGDDIVAGCNASQPGYWCGQ